MYFPFSKTLKSYLFPVCTYELQSIHFSFCSHGSPSFSDGDVVVVNS